MGTEIGEWTMFLCVLSASVAKEHCPVVEISFDFAQDRLRHPASRDQDDIRFHSENFTDSVIRLNQSDPFDPRSICLILSKKRN